MHSFFRSPTALLLYTLTLSFSSPAWPEDIAGFEFGGEFQDRNDHVEIAGKTVLPHEYRVDDVQFFDRGEVGTNNEGLIRSLTFIKNYDVSTTNINVTKREIKSDFERVLNGLEERWGEFDKSNARYILGLSGETGLIYMNDVREVAENTTPKSEEVGRVMLMLTSTAEADFIMGEPQKVSLALIYLDKKLDKELREKRESELRGF